MTRCPILRLRGLPFTADDAAITNTFFEGYRVEGLHLLQRGGKPTGEAYVEFTNTEEAERALTAKQRAHFGPRYIELFEAGEAALVARATAPAESSEPSLSGIVLRLRGLPFTAVADDVLSFIDPVHSVGGARGIVFTCGADGRPTGEAFLQVATDEDRDAVLARHKERMGQRYIEIFDSSKGDLYQAVFHRGFFTAVKGTREHHPPITGAPPSPGGSGGLVTSGGNGSGSGAASGAPQPSTPSGSGTRPRGSAGAAALHHAFGALSLSQQDKQSGTAGQTPRHSPHGPPPMYHRTRSAPQPHAWGPRFAPMPGREAAPAPQGMFLHPSGLVPTVVGQPGAASANVQRRPGYLGGGAGYEMGHQAMIGPPAMMHHAYVAHPPAFMQQQQQHPQQHSQQQQHTQHPAGWGLSPYVPPHHVMPAWGMSVPRGMAPPVNAPQFVRYGAYYGQPQHSQYPSAGQHQHQHRQHQLQRQPSSRSSAPLRGQPWQRHPTAKRADSQAGPSSSSQEGTQQEQAGKQRPTSAASVKGEANRIDPTPQSVPSATGANTPGQDSSHPGRPASANSVGSLESSGSVTLDAYDHAASPG